MDTEIILRFLLAALWGGIVGMEREYNSKSAGLRTMMLISIGACFFTIMSIHLGKDIAPDRIASNIVTGIGFLGAGVIFRGQNRVNGITTAATIWVVAAVGMGIGGGYYLAAISASILVVIILAMLPSLESLVDRVNQSREYTVFCSFTSSRVDEIEQSFSKHRLRYKLLRELKDGNELRLVWFVRGKARYHRAMLAELMADSSIRRIEY